MSPLSAVKRPRFLLPRIWVNRNLLLACLFGLSMWALAIWLIGRAFGIWCVVKEAL